MEKFERQDASGNFHDVSWRISYRTSSINPDGRPVDILHDFYIPVLKRSVRYDRVAGYFRSTSLSAASQGFSAFVGRSGKMRLIVGADMDADDVAAILSGTQDRLETRLQRELDGIEGWPDDVRRGVELLAWMVAHDNLEVRVAFRVHGKNGQPLSVDATDDGYVHEKWAVFTDQGGNRLYASGSLNESRTALSLNAENLDIHCDWWGQREHLRVDEAERDFEAMWEDQHPCLRVFTLPDAVKAQLLHIAERVHRPEEIDGTSAAPVEVPPPSVKERLQFALLKNGPKLPGGQYVGLETAPVTPWPHQMVVARRLIDTWPYSYLLCDEVGLGKTIEAGLAIRSLYLSGLVRRVLIAPPASLAEQWQREMATKFFLPFGRATGGRHVYLLPDEEERVSDSLYDPDLTIVSTGLVARKERQAELERARPFDLVLIDEAHYARRQNPGGTRVAPRYGNLYQTIDERLRPKSRSLWLATATPMQIDPVEVADLLKLTNRVGAFQFDERLTLSYYEILGQLVDQVMSNMTAQIGEKEWAFLQRAIQEVSRLDPMLWSYVDRVVIDPAIRLSVTQWLEHNRIPHAVDLKGVLRVIFAASPLSRVMLRHTRGLLEIYRDEGKLTQKLARREILPIPRISFTPQERMAYDRLEAYCQGLTKQISEHGARHQQSAIGFLLSFLRLRFASSLFAIRETLRRRLERVEATLNHLTSPQNEDMEDLDQETIYGDQDDDAIVVHSFLKDRTPQDLTWEREQIRPMLEELSDLTGMPSKMRVLLDAIEKWRIEHTSRIRQMVIFTRFYDTLTDIVGRLRRVDANMLIGTYSGKGGQYFDGKTGRMVSVARERIKQRFLRGEIDVLICTDAAAEGLNLQTADLLINFDLPWNPMKVEQRIGRIDRIGQKHDHIYVLNLCYVDSAEEKVYGRLLHRLQQAGAIVGTQQMSLLPVTPDEFEKLASGDMDEQELAKSALERAKRAKRRTDSMEIPPQELYAIYQRLAQYSTDVVPPITMDRIWQVLSESVYLQGLGCRVLPETDRRVLILSGISDLPEGTGLTASRTTYEEGLNNLGGRLHFATYGDPVFDLLLDQITAFELPPCIHKITAQIAGAADRVGYAVACIEGGVSAIRLVTRLEDLENLEIDESATLSEGAIQPLMDELVTQTQKAFRIVLTADRIDRENRRAGYAQLILAYMVMRSYLQMRQRLGHDGYPFWQELAQIEGVFNEDAPVGVHHLPIEHLRQLSGLLFDPIMPVMGAGRFDDVPDPMRKAALDAICRLADGMRVRRSELTINAVVDRAGREIDNLIQGLPS